MSKLEFSGAWLRGVSLDRDKSGPYMKLEFGSNYSGPVCKAMGWNEAPYGEKQGVLIGALVASNLILTPNKKLSKEQLDLAITTVDHFTFHVLKSTDGESTRTELRFNVKSVEANMAGVVEEFYRLVTEEAKGKCVVTYSEQKQMDLAPEEPAGDEEQAEGAQE